MSLDSLKGIFDEYTQDTLKIDRKFIQMVKKWKLDYYSRNPDHVGFFTGNYFGTHIPKWTGYDDDYWLIEVLGIDEDEIADYVYRLPAINKDFVVSSNILSIGFIYMMHRLYIDKSMTEQERIDGMQNLMEILCARYLTSIINNYFNRGRTTVEIAKETYDRLSRRFDLKEAGSWMKMIEMRSRVFLTGDTIQNVRFNKLEVFKQLEDSLVVRKLNAVKSSLNKTIVEINAVFRQVLDDQSKIASQKTLANGEDGLYVRDLVRQDSLYMHYQESLFTDRNSFFRLDLMEIIEDSMDTISPKIFRGTLEWIFDNQHEKKYRNDIDTLRKTILIYGLDLLREEGIKNTDFVQVAYRLRQNFMSGKTSDAKLVQCRKLADKFIIAYRPKSKGKIITLERTAILIYIVLRSLLMPSK